MSHMPVYSSRVYTNTAKLQADKARESISMARETRRLGAAHYASRCLMDAQAHRRNYQRCMRQAAMVREVEALEAMATHWRQQADKATHRADAEYCRNVATELNDKARAMRERARAHR